MLLSPGLVELHIARFVVSLEVLSSACYLCLSLDSLTRWFGGRGCEERWRLLCESYKKGSLCSTCFFLSWLEDEYSSSSALWNKQQRVRRWPPLHTDVTSACVCSPLLVARWCGSAETPAPSFHCSRSLEGRSDNLQEQQVTKQLICSTRTTVHTKIPQETVRHQEYLLHVDKSWWRCRQNVTATFFVSRWATFMFRVCVWFPTWAEAFDRKCGLSQEVGVWEHVLLVDHKAKVGEFWLVDAELHGFCRGFPHWVQTIITCRRH